MTAELWNKVVESSAALVCLETTRYLTRISSIHQQAYDLIRIHSDGAAALSTEHGDSLQALLRSNPDLLNTDDPAAFENLEKQVRAHAEAKVREYPDWIINQSVVSLCTFFDGFLIDLVDVMFQEKVEFLRSTKAWSRASKSKVPLELEEIESVREDALWSFSRLRGIKERVRFLEGHLEVPLLDIFDWSTFNNPTRLEKWDLEALGELFHKRNNIVHGDESCFHSIDELSEVALFFGDLVLSISIQFRKKHGILLDFNRTVLQYELYEKMKKQESGA